MSFINDIDLSEFKESVDNGLSQEDKQLSSKYFYDAAGDRLFQAIMHMPEYYLTQAEQSIFVSQGADIAAAIPKCDAQLDVIELGAGDGSKVKYLLNALSQQHTIRYLPIDISAHALSVLEETVQAHMPGLSIKTICGEYFSALSRLPDAQGQRLVLFLGSNIGNFSHDSAIDFLSAIGSRLSPGDQLLLGVDINQDPDTLLRAYNDSDGITKAFNLNLLERINRELGGNFDVDAFDHDPIYVEGEHAAYSYLTSRKQQSVYISSLDKQFNFNAGEQIHTEVSRKFSREHVAEMADRAGFKLTTQFVDSDGLFADFLLTRDFNSSNESL